MNPEEQKKYFGVSDETFEAGAIDTKDRKWLPQIWTAFAKFLTEEHERRINKNQNT